MDTTFHDLPPGVIDHIVNSVLHTCSLQDVENLALTSRVFSTTCRTIIHDQRTKIQEWLNTSIKPVAGNPKHVKQFKKLDRQILWFATRSSTSLIISKLAGIERKWVHERAGQMGLGTETTNRQKWVGDVMITKPHSWKPSEWFKIPSTKQPKPKPPKAPKQSRMDTWSTECDMCGCDLDAYEALYHYSGMGPYCEDCIDDDPELEGLKWEARADFW